MDGQACTRPFVAGKQHKWGQLAQAHFQSGVTQLQQAVLPRRDFVLRVKHGTVPNDASDYECC